MKYKIVPPSKIDVKINLSSSKSISNRALIINALSYSPLEIKNLSDSDDTQVLWKALNSNSTTFDVGPAGTAMRFLTAFLSKVVGEWVITGSERMKNRPIRILVDALTDLGAKIEYLEKEGYPPLKIFGSALRGKEIELEGNVSSQYISALLMIAPYMEDGLTLKLKNKIISKPYIEQTLKLMQYFGVNYVWEGNVIRIEQQTYKVKEITVEPDWSAASYWYEVLSLFQKGSVFIAGLTRESLQGDSQCRQMFEKLGVQSLFSPEGVKLKPGKVKNGLLEINFIDQPDLAQTLVVAATLNNIHFRFTGLQSLKIKETDRMYALITELAKLGYQLRESEENVLEWDGAMCEAQKNPTIHTYEDHRMAMAFAPAAIKFPGLIINDPEVVSKSYPGYWNDLRNAGFVLEAIS